MTEQEREGVELLLRDPQIVAWLELEDAEVGQPDEPPRLRDNGLERLA